MTAAINFAALFNATTATTTHRGRAPNHAPRQALREVILSIAAAIRATAEGAENAKVQVSRVAIIDQMIGRGYSKPQVLGLIRELVGTEPNWLIQHNVAILQDSARGASGRTGRNLEMVTDLIRRMSAEFPEGIPRPELMARATAVGIAASAVKQHEEAAAAAAGVVIRAGRRGGRTADPVKVMITDAFIAQVMATGCSVDQINCAQGGAQLSAAWDAYHAATNADGAVVVDGWSASSAAAYLRNVLRKMQGVDVVADAICECAEEVGEGAEEVAEDAEEVGEDAEEVGEGSKNLYD